MPIDFRGRLTGAAQRAIHNDECSICFEPLSVMPTVNLCKRDGSFSCIHVFHSRCIEQLRGPKICPICREAFSTTKEQPSLRFNPRAWFDHLDEDKNGELMYEEILDGLKAQLVLDWRTIEAEMDRNWHRWDRDGNGGISFEEFIDPDGGVLQFLQEHFPAQPRPPPPNLTQKNKMPWFDYWDEDNSGALGKTEVVRALIKTFNLYDMDTDHLRDMVDEIWPIFDTDDSGEINRAEFIARDNLADTIIAQCEEEERHRRRK